MRITRIERTIGVGILVKESQRLTPLAAHPPWLARLAHERQMDPEECPNLPPAPVE
jgi:hypothetical protein